MARTSVQKMAVIEVVAFAGNDGVTGEPRKRKRKAWRPPR